MKVPDLNFSVGIVYCLHQLATHSDKVDKELLPYIFSKLPKLISFVADITYVFFDWLVQTTSHQD
jgi:hypothetical protein